MSYEGFVRRLCANGHMRVFDAWDDDEEPPSATHAFPTEHHAPPQDDL